MSTSADQTNLGKIAKILSIDISAKPHVQLVKKKPQIKITQENLTDDENENQVESKIFKKLADNNVKGHYFESSNLNFLFQKEETKGDDIEIENNNDWQILDQDKQGIQMTLEQTQELFDTKKQNYIIESDCQIEELKYEIDQDDQSFQISDENSFSETNIMKSIKKSRYLPDIYEKIRPIIRKKNKQ
ncbi:UNKNOWN [Stylonychia lemnae]|uniref:Uncharacterized protein n=1 Tax=Stylonychia lemnae TaxID=5949 RepID=A0A078ABW3_STYLE|nr:UNKNOWN [Stylonychia lemnae]|eukprot:CDW79785.1 UNKNOWN [Stylonychia lemnae]